MPLLDFSMLNSLLFISCEVANCILAILLLLAGATVNVFHFTGNEVLVKTPASAPISLGVSVMRVCPSKSTVTIGIATPLDSIQLE